MILISSPRLIDKKRRILRENAQLRARMVLEELIITIGKIGPEMGEGNGHNKGPSSSRCLLVAAVREVGSVLSRYCAHAR